MSALRRGGVVLLLAVGGPWTAHGQVTGGDVALLAGRDEPRSAGVGAPALSADVGSGALSAPAIPVPAPALPVSPPVLRVSAGGMLVSASMPDHPASAVSPGSLLVTRPAPPERRLPRESTGRIARATVMSALVPGAGQFYVGQRRGWVYLTLEVIAWGFWIDRRSAGADARDRYRDFAWDEARIHDGPRVDGDFDFYETLSNWERSGAYDVDPASAGVQPESDVATFNGTIWRRAEGLYLPGGADTPESDPGYLRALGYYADFAYADGFLWDWRGSGEARETYAGLIRSSDDRYREATNVMGAIIANHVVSAVDAFLSSRGMALPVEARVLPAAGIGGTRWTAHMSLKPR